MLINVDEDLPPITAQLLRQAGYETSMVVEQGMGGWKYPQLWRAIQAEKRFLITADKGFANIKAYPPSTYMEVLLLRPDNDGIRPVLALIENVLANFDLKSLAGTVTVATPRGLRIRR